jgi:hypothetical protein
MDNRTDRGAEEIEWGGPEAAVLARVRSVSRRIVERVREVLQGVPPDRRIGPDDPTDEAPAAE